MTGSIAVIGLGPGHPDQVTPEASRALTAADELFGYGLYLERVPERPGQLRHASDNRQELSRAGAALDRAAAGTSVAIVSGGDAGVFGMAAAVCEAIEEGPPAWRAVELRVVPGLTAVLAVAARVGAPLGHDFCVLSLSDNLKPWTLVERRLAAAAEAGFVLALYNPISRARPWQLGRAFALLTERLPATTPVVFGSHIGRTGEHVSVVPLAEADPAAADMSTCIIVGSAASRTVWRPGLPPLVYAPRAASETSR